MSPIIKSMELSGWPLWYFPRVCPSHCQVLCFSGNGCSYWALTAVFDAASCILGPPRTVSLSLWMLLDLHHRCIQAGTRQLKDFASLGSGLKSWIAMASMQPCLDLKSWFCCRQIWLATRSHYLGKWPMFYMPVCTLFPNLLWTIRCCVPCTLQKGLTYSHPDCLYF